MLYQRKTISKDFYPGVFVDSKEHYQTILFLIAYDPTDAELHLTQNFNISHQIANSVQTGKKREKKNFFMPVMGTTILIQKHDNDLLKFKRKLTRSIQM